jgi:hypothetical protein
MEVTVATMMEVTVATLIDTNKVGLGQVVRKVRQHPEDHRFESQQWQGINFPF